ncbi:uncharacterized protein LOC130775398 [Actinidia eriantha]|uniref:uncharacterized protein LOC130775398 n=1 Tax=Actinidia eriantha TaxID=165200 RepID=UPI00258B5567|nr:uncharacterized protein LOC130775398 [Actinidia eriantha]
MDTTLYRAAMEGNIDALIQNKELLENNLTPTNNTVLHVAAQFGMYRKVNSRGDTSLHVAAREGHSTIVQALVEYANALDEELENGVVTAKDMMRMTNEERDTALHEAVRNHHPFVVQFLTKEDPEFYHPGNNAEETPLYLTAERAYLGLVFVILETCTAPAYGGPGGRTALHSAVIHNLEGSAYLVLFLFSLLRFHFWKTQINCFRLNFLTTTHLSENAREGCEIPEIVSAQKRNGYEKNENFLKNLYFSETGKMYEKTTRLETCSKETDMHGWTPLHYAARFGYASRARELLNVDKSVAYLADKHDKKTALHLAASHGNVRVMEELISYCPDCWEMVDGRGKNILHIAAKNEKKRVIKFILRNFPFSSLINQKDVDGNTLLHLLAASDCCELGLIKHPKVDRMAFNRENLTPLEVVYCNKNAEPWKNTKMQGFTKRGLIKAGANLGWRDVISRDRVEMEAKEQHHVHEKILPIDIRRAADTKSPSLLVSSYQAASMAMKALTESFQDICVVADDSDGYKLLKNSASAKFLIIISMGAMVLAFITGMYAALPHTLGLTEKDPGKAIVTLFQIGLEKRPGYCGDSIPNRLKERSE